MDLEALLEPYRSSMVNELHWEVSRRVLARSLRHSYRQQPASSYAREAYMAVTFDFFCAPPGATLEQNVLGAWLTLVFFKADDGATSELEAFLEPGRAGEGTELQACYEELREELRAMGRETGRLDAALRQMCACMLEERRLDKATLTEEQYHRLRHHTVGVPSYTACRVALLGLSLSEEAWRELEDSALLEATAALVYTANDLGSLERDEEVAQAQPQRQDLSLVLLKKRLLGSRDAAIQQTVELYHQRREQFIQARRRLARSPLWAEPAVREYVEVLRAMANGNVAATRHLVPLRYSGSRALLDQLEELGPLEI